MIRELPLSAMLLLASLPAWGGKSCDELKSEIAAKLQGKGVTKFSLEAVPAGTVKPEDRVVGRCESGTKQLIYKRS